MKWFRGAWRKVRALLRGNPVKATVRLPGGMACRLHLPAPHPIAIDPPLLAQLSPTQAVDGLRAARQAADTIERTLASGVWLHPLSQAARPGATVHAVLARQHASQPSSLALLRLF